VRKKKAIAFAKGRQRKKGRSSAGKRDLRNLKLIGGPSRFLQEKEKTSIKEKERLDEIDKYRRKRLDRWKLGRRKGIGKNAPIPPERMGLEEQRTVCRGSLEGLF